MKKPAHPGEIVRRDCLEPRGLSVTKAARILGVSRQALNNVVNAKASISTELAVRLTNEFGGTAETWLAMQLAYDLAVDPSPGRTSEDALVALEAVINRHGDAFRQLAEFDRTGRRHAR